MAGLMGRFFDFRSKEEKAISYEAYSKRIFPYGEEQKEKVSELLGALFPEVSHKYLIMYYILTKQGMTEEEAKDFETSIKEVTKYRLIKVTPELKAAFRALLNIDLAIDEKLEYPSTKEIQVVIQDILSSESNL